MNFMRPVAFGTKAQVWLPMKSWLRTVSAELKTQDAPLEYTDPDLPGLPARPPLPAEFARPARVNSAAAAFAAAAGAASSSAPTAAVAAAPATSTSNSARDGQPVAPRFDSLEIDEDDTDDSDYDTDDAEADEAAEKEEDEDDDHLFGDVIEDDDEDGFGFLSYKNIEKMGNKVSVIPLDIADYLNYVQHFQEQSPDMQRRMRLILRLMHKTSAHAQAMLLKRFFKDLAGSQSEAEEVHHFDCKLHPLVLLFKGTLLQSVPLLFVGFAAACIFCCAVFHLIHVNTNF